MKKFLTGEKNRTKKNTTEKMTTPMPMGRKKKKWMRLYMALVLTVTVGATTAFAAGVTVPNAAPVAAKILLTVSRQAVRIIRLAFTDNIFTKVPASSTVL